MAYLYKNISGKEVTINSFSSGQLFKSCAYKYFLIKVKGFKRKDNSAALKFGRALEEAIQFFHENGLDVDSAVIEFKRRWLHEKDNSDIKYTKSEISFENLYRVGSELIQLYAIMLPSLPIKDPVWQANYKVTPFPGTHLDGIQDQGFVDLLSRAPWVHNLLPKTDIPKGASPYRPLGIDLKTSGKKLETSDEMLRLDSQLMRYAALSGISDWAFLWFVKSSATAYRSGTEFTVLELSGKWTPGFEGTVLSYDEETETVTGCARDIIESLKDKLAEIKGKGSTERKDAQIAEWLADGTLCKITIDKTTKQTIQFKAVRIHQDDIKEAAQIAGKEIADIHNCNETGFWPKTTGVRFPNNQCSWCECRGLCLRDDRLRDELLVQITNPADDEWLDGVGEEEE